MAKQTINTYEFFRKFPDDKTAREYLEYRRWKDRIACPHCDSLETSRMKDSQYHQCNVCRRKFTVRTGMVFERSHIPLNKWLYTIYLLAIDGKRVSSLQLSKEIDITQKTAWFMLRRLGEACGGDWQKLSGIVEMDEIYIGEKEGNKDDTKLRTVEEFTT